MKRQRGFEIVDTKIRRCPEATVKLPVRSTADAAGYDFFSNERVVLQPGDDYIFWTDVKAYMLPDEVLHIYVRSSIAIKKNAILKNQVGIIDADYYNNIVNDGNIGICLKNNGDEYILISIGDRIAQGVFGKYLIADEDTTIMMRTGGMGSTNKDNEK